MKTKKSGRVLSLLLSAVMVFAMLPATAFAATVEVSTEQALKNAIAAANNSTVIKLTSGISIATGFTIANNARFTIDLNGQTISFDRTATEGIVYNGTGSLTITDSSANKAGKINSDWSELVFMIENRSTGTVNVTGGSMYGSNCQIIRNTGTGTINISGGSMQQDYNLSDRMIDNRSTGIINISGGTLTVREGRGAIEDKTNGQINISGGKISGTASLVTSSGTGTVNISGGTLEASGDYAVAVSMTQGTLTVTQANDSNPTMISSQSQYATLDNNITTTVPVKIIFDIQGGTIKNTRAQGKAISFDNRSNVKGENVYNFLSIAPEATIQGIINPASRLPVISNDPTLRAAISRATVGSVIVLTGDITLTEGTLAIAKDVDITIDLNGHHLGTTGNFDTITNSGTKALNITDNSAAKSGLLDANGGGDQNCALRNTGTGTINVKRGTVTTTKPYPAIVNDGTGKIIIGGKATISSANTSTTNGGTIRINAVPASGDTRALEIQGGTVKNTATDGYSVYFSPSAVTKGNVDNYLTIAPNAKVIGKRHPAPKPVFGVDYNVVGGTGSGSRLERALDTIATDPNSGITAEDQADGNIVVIRLTVAEKAAVDTADSEKIEGVKQGDGLQYYDVKVEKTVTTPTGSSTTNLTSIPKPVRAVIPVPAAIQGQNNYSVYRIHNGAAEKIPNDPTALEFYSLSADGKSLILHVRKFSTYAVITNNKALTGSGTLGDATKPTSSAVDVQGKVIEGTFGIYKLDISWGAMKFNYNSKGGVWNPDTHVYDAGGVEKGWINESFDATNNKITVANHSNGDVMLSYSAKLDAVLAGATMTVRVNNSAQSVEAVNLLLEKVPGEKDMTAPTATAYVWLTGDPNSVAGLDDKSYTKAGVITITAEPDTAGGLTPKKTTP